MLRSRLSRKAVAATFLAILANSTFSPAISYALTSGPTQPEATNFEPIDTTDMVNQQTGDFTYNIPLLEVPGPEGGYPLALSYHAGTLTQMDASWVGLGWSLNTGEINRSVNGYPDDWSHVGNTNRVYWSGGSTTQYDVGISIGIANTPATVNFGLSFANDTYRGFGVGVSEGVGGSFKIGSLGLNVGLNAGISPYGQAYTSADASLGPTIGSGKGITGSFGLSATTNFKSIDVGGYAGVGYNFGQHDGQSWSTSALGVSLNSSGQFTPSIGGISSTVSNSNADHVSTSSKGFHVDIPVYYGVNLSLGYSKQRYWTDETVSVTTLGSLYASGYATSGSAGPDNLAYDEYSLLDDPNYKNSYSYPDPTKVQGGAYPDFDVYTVNAQGLGGNMRPYLYQGGLLNQNLKNGSTPLVTYYNPGVTNNRPYFRWVNDFSNTYRQNAPAYTDASYNLRYVAPPMDASPVYGSNDGNCTTSGNCGYGYPTDNTGSTGFALSGSKDIDLRLKVAPLNDLGYNKADMYVDGGMIEGYSITNESGMTYHFGLPAYSYGEENYQEKIAHNSDGTVNAFNRVSRANPYAYTWYLTTITGPDYVDRNQDGKADDGDWGYWVDFEYGKWSNNYCWRNPATGYTRDEDNRYQDVSMGRKEVYYLNAIRTRTHVALFEKKLRYDGQGAAPGIFSKNFSGANDSTDYSVPGAFAGGSSPSLALSKIYLLNASDEGTVTTTSDANNTIYTNLSGVMSSGSAQGANVLDNYDVDAAGRATLESKAIRVIDFNYDYSLCPGTANSFDNTDPALVRQGKLTLNSLVTRGKGGTSILPPMKFTYDLTGTDVNTATGATLSPGSFTSTNTNFHVGDMVMCSSPAVYCGVITGVSISGSTATYTLLNSNYTGSAITATVYTTKNPPYNQDFYDAWGNYKSDYSAVIRNYSENAGRVTSSVSALGTDAWSLRTVTTPLGSVLKVKMEPDKVISTNYSPSYTNIITNLAIDGGVYNKVTFKVNTNGVPLSDLVSVGDHGANIVMLIQYEFYSGSFSPDDEEVNGGGEYSNFQVWNDTYTVTAIDGDGTVHATLKNGISQYLPGTNGFSTYSVFKFWTGNISTSNASGTFGGGLRTSQLSLTNGDGTQYLTSYDYTNPSTGLTSGVSSYTPFVVDSYDTSSLSSLGSYLQGVVGNNIYAVNLNKDLFYLYSIARELPPPNVLYEYVTVSNQIKNPDESSTRTIEGAQLYQFEVPRRNMVGRTDVTPRTGPISTSLGNMSSRNLTLQKFVGCIGNLRRVVRYDKAGSGRKALSETIYHYLHDGLESLPVADFMSQYKTRLANYGYQGYIQERYFEVKEVQNQSNSADNGVLATLSGREEFPCIATGETDINYVNGTKSSNQVLAFDFYSGAITKQVETDPYGNSFMQVTKPAYKVYATMGLKFNSNNHKNMLTQAAENYVYKVDASNNILGLISATATTWNDGFYGMDPYGNTHLQNGTSEGSTYTPNGDVWRPQYTYDWMPSGQTSDGTTPIANFPTTADFNFTTPASSDARWIKTDENTLYDVFSKKLEHKDLYGNYSSVHMTYGQKKVSVAGSPANYYELGYNGAEDSTVYQTTASFFQTGGGTVTTAAAHTGAKSLLLNTGGTKGFVYTVNTNNLTPGKNYIASVWVKPVSGTASDVKLYYSVNGGTAKASASSSVSTKTAGGWTLVNLSIPGSDITAGVSFSLWCQNDHASAQAYVDDIRFQPASASSMAYVYDAFSGELTDVLDNSNTYTRFEYDATGRLVNTYKEKIGVGEYKTSTYEYNYGSLAVYQSAAINQPYTKNNCPAADGGGTVTITLPLGAATSVVSQADADAKAQAMAQVQANTTASCILPAPLVLANPTGAVTYRAILSGASSVSYIFPTSGTYTETNTLKPGVYTITIVQTSGTTGTTHQFSVTNGSTHLVQSGLTTTFSNVSVSGTLTVSIDN